MTDLKLADLEPEDRKWLFEKRFEFAWQSFEFHAKQRTTVFNFFLLAAAILANGYARLLTDEKFAEAAAISGAGALLMIAFRFLEHRNEELVHVAEDVLRELERDVLFCGYRRKIRWPRRRTWLGLMEAEPEETERQLGIHLREKADVDGKATKADGEEEPCATPDPKKSRFRHGRWFPIIQWGFLLVFSAGSFYAAGRALGDGVANDEDHTVVACDHSACSGPQEEETGQAGSAGPPGPSGATGLADGPQGVQGPRRETTGSGSD